MIKPRFKKISAPRLDETLRDFFIDGLGYERIENDPGENRCDPHRWRIIVPAPGSQPFAVAYQPGLSAMERREVSKLYIDRVIPHRDGSPAVVPCLYGFTDGARYVVFSADPAHNRDDRFDLSAETWGLACVKDRVERLRACNLEFQERAGRTRPRVEFLFETNALSADSGFKSYIHAMRRRLMGVVVADRRALGAVVYHLLESPGARRSGSLRFVDQNQNLKVALNDLHLESGASLGDAVAAAVDTLLLRYIVVRFLEAYHPNATERLLDAGVVLKKRGRRHTLGPARGDTAGEGTKAGRTLFGGNSSGDVPVAEWTATELELTEIVGRRVGVDVSEDERTTNFGGDFYGDFYPADPGKAARAIQRALLREPGSRGSKLVRDFLGSTGDADRARRGFRYQDLRPKTLQDYYESSLGTAVRLSFDQKTDSFAIEVGESRKQRKELGAYYTEARLCRLMVERAVAPLFETRLEQLRKSIASKNAVAARVAFDGVVHFSVCDPAMGSAPFLRSAFDYLSAQYPRLCRTIAEAKSALPDFYFEATSQLPFLKEEEKRRLGEGGVERWEWHILRRMLYGIDIDLKAVNIACQTLNLSALEPVKHGERFPSFFNVNLKPGNALVSPTKPDDRPELSRRHGRAIARLIKLRREAKSLPNSEEAYQKLAALVKKIEETRVPVVRELVRERLAPLLQKYTDELRPFCWELEFPELFFNADGSVKGDAGFDAIIGNPPWESLEVQTNEFFEQFHKGYGTLKPASKKAEVRRKLLADDRIERAFEHRNATVASLVKLVKPEAGFFELQHTVLDGERKRSEYATYKMMVEQCLRLVKPGGHLSMVVPSGFTGDLGCYLLRRRIFETCDMPYLRGFRETSGIFLNATQAFCVFYLETNKTTSQITCLTGLSSLDDFDARNAGVVPFSIELVKRMAPLSWAIPSISEPLKLSVLEKLYGFPVMNDKSLDSWNAEVSYAELNATNNSAMFHETGWDIPIWEGKLISAYGRAPAPNVGARREEFARLRHPRVIDEPRVVIRSVAGSETTRRLISTLLPARYAIMNSLNYLEPGLNDEPTKIFLAACLNSFVLEWRARQLATNNNVNGFVIRQLPVPRLTKGDRFFDQTVERAASLLFADPELRDSFKTIAVRPALDPIERTKLRCEIDALIAAIYGLTEPELRLILDTFSDVDPTERDAVMKAFRRIYNGLRVKAARD